MPAEFQIFWEGRAIPARRGQPVAVALANHFGAAWSNRRTASGEDRAPFCGMGSCFECLVVTEGGMARRSCLLVCQPNLRLEKLRD